MSGSGSRSAALIEAPERLRTSRSTPGSRSGSRTVSLNAGRDGRTSPAARRGEPSRVTAAVHSGCSVRTAAECAANAVTFKGFPVTSP